MKNKDVKVKNDGMEKTLVKYASYISGAVVSILNALTVVENCCAEIEKNRIICQNQSMMIDNEILKITFSSRTIFQINNSVRNIFHNLFFLTFLLLRYGYSAYEKVTNKNYLKTRTTRVLYIINPVCFFM